MGIKYQYCDKLRTIPSNKIAFKKAQIISNCPTCGVDSSSLSLSSSQPSPSTSFSSSSIAKCQSCMLKCVLMDRYYQANIPLIFFEKTMDKFEGSPNLIQLYNELTKINDFNNTIMNGNSFLIKGMFGTGKTYFASMLLKECAIKGYNGLYTILYDIVSLLIQGSYSDKNDATRELKLADLLVIDEFDPRFFPSDNAAELYGRILESILRGRLQNNLSTILITNNLNPTDNLGGDFGKSIASLLSGHVKEITVIGRDFRKTLQK